MPHRFNRDPAPSVQVEQIGTSEPERMIGSRANTKPAMINKVLYTKFSSKGLVHNVGSRSAQYPHDYRQHEDERRVPDGSDVAGKNKGMAIPLHMQGQGPYGFPYCQHRRGRDEYQQPSE